MLLGASPPRWTYDSSDAVTRKKAGKCRTFERKTDATKRAVLWMLAAGVNSTLMAGENLTVGSTAWLPAESLPPGR
jgi:hypothetical protein